MARVLLVVPEEELADKVKALLESELNKPAIYSVPSEEEAHVFLDDEDSRLDLVVTHLVIPENRRSVPDPAEQRGFKLLERAKEIKREVAKILFVDGKTPVIERAINAIPRCEIIENKLSLEQNLKESLGRLLNEAPAGERRRRDSYDVEISLGHKVQTYRMRMPGVAEIEGILTVNETTLDRLVRRSHHLRNQPNYETFEEMLSIVGEELLEEFQRNPEFQTDLTRLLTRADDDISKTRFRFTVEPEDISLYPLALEAIKKPGESFWMLKAPVSRRVGRRSPQYVLPLFSSAGEDVGEIRCLIVASQTSGVFEELKTSFDPIDKVVDECEWVNEFLCSEKKQKPKVPCDCRMLDAREARRQGVGLEELLKSELSENGPWHLVHYAGHSYFREDQGGYLILPAEAEGQMKEVAIAEFAHWLRRAKNRFLYLSSCDSSSEEIIFELIKEQVPAILGFRWDLNDASAADYSEGFYKELLTNDRPSVEYSFFRARQRIYSKYRREGDRIWAAPMLVMQS